MKTAIVVEALSRVKRHKIWFKYGPPKKDAVAIHRPANLTQDEVKTIIDVAERQVGKEVRLSEDSGSFRGLVAIGSIRIQETSSWQEVSNLFLACGSLLQQSRQALRC